MTAYFDDLCTELDSFDVSVEFPSEAESLRIRAIESRLVDDCTITSMAPEFPAELRALITKTILLGSVDHQSPHLPPEYVTDFEYFRDHVRTIHKLGSDLHDIFHAVALDLDCPFGDDPKSWIRTQAARGEELRDEMAANLAGTTVEAIFSELNAKYNDR